MAIIPLNGKQMSKGLGVEHLAGIYTLGLERLFFFGDSNKLGFL